MKAVRIHEYGNEDVLKLEDIPIPEIKEDELLIRIYASGVNPVDWKIREGGYRAMNIHILPLTLGWDLSGVVEKAGSKASGFKPGDEVYSRPPVERNGTYAEFIAVPAKDVARKPPSLTHVEAAGVPLAGITAWESLVTTAGIQKGQKVLIHAASGGVGSFAVQIAKAKGCYVIGTTSTINVDLVKSLGADEVIDYKKVEFSEHLKDVDVVFDTLGGTVFDNSWKVLKKGGMLVSITHKQEVSIADSLGVRSAFVLIGPNVPVLNQLTDLIEDLKIRPLIDSVFSLEEVKKAQLLSQSGRARGKIVLKVKI
jgi:NADPH:quinone reductase-like Zn-dependent oxidoreductase